MAMTDGAQVFAALGDPTRRSLVETLSADGPLNASVLAEQYPVSRQAIVKHLAVLSDAGIVTAERHGNEVRYAVVPGSFDAVTTWLEQVGTQWDRRMVALRKHVRSR